jgi:hypothetical protein
MRKDERLQRRQIGLLLAAISRRNKVNKLWQPVGEPTIVSDKHHLRRQIRYVALNPCRKKLCEDPLSWYWSTYREVMGVAPEREGSARCLARILGDPLAPFRVRFHAYVSGDPSVSITGTPFPDPAEPTQFAEKSIGEILSASASALRIDPHQIRREGPLRLLFVHMAHRHGWTQTALLAEYCGVGTHAIRKMLKKPIPTAQIRAADLCLGDERLRTQRACRLPLSPISV